MFLCVSISISLSLLLFNLSPFFSGYVAVVDFCVYGGFLYSCQRTSCTILYDKQNRVSCTQSRLECSVMYFAPYIVFIELFSLIVGGNDDDDDNDNVAAAVARIHCHSRQVLSLLLCV